MANTNKTRVGLIVNPIAGMGGSVGLKGTDGGIIVQAKKLGAKPVTPDRCRSFLASFARHDEITWYAAPGSMGEDYLTQLEIPCHVVGKVPRETTDTDTVRIARHMLDHHISLLVYVGGDGTARDIHTAIGTKVPTVGVPSGVKVYSAAFALSPRAAAEILNVFLDGTVLSEQEVLDIDEEAFRQDRLEVHFAGYLLVPDVQKQVQPGKEGTHLTPDTLDNQMDIAAGLVEDMHAEYLYLLGPGTTIKAVAQALGIPKTLLGVDAVLGNGKLVGSDINEQGILSLLESYAQAYIVATPLGGNGFVFGRGNKQFTPEVIRRVGIRHILIAATEEKISTLGSLRVDTGDTVLDQQFPDYVEVMIGYRKARVVKIEAV
ncbi:MAG: ATP-NAD kinase family protein [Anaerolineae bacterium]|nr:ATP-NAD kinase family protein [Anaerolineae bacterium]